MLLSSDKLLRLPVFTKSNTRLGRVRGFEFETDRGAILRYDVRGGFFGSRKYLVHQSQVISIEANKMVVEDLVVGEPVVEKTVRVQPAAETKPAPLSRN